MAAPKPRARIGPKSGPVPAGRHRYRPLIAAGLSGIGPLPGCGHRGRLARNSGGLSAIPALSAPPDQRAGHAIGPAIGLATKGRGAPALGKWMGGCPRHSLLFAMAEPDASSVFLALLPIAIIGPMGQERRKARLLWRQSFQVTVDFFEAISRGNRPRPIQRHPCALLISSYHIRIGEPKPALKIIGVFI